MIAYADLLERNPFQHAGATEACPFGYPCAEGVQDVMRHRLGLRIRIVPAAPGVLPRSENKSRRAVDLRERGWV